MVKTKATLLAKAALPAALVVLLACCAQRQQGFLLHPESMTIPVNTPGRFMSLAVAGTNLLAVFSEKETTTLKFMQLPLGARLPAEAPAPTIVDKVDVSPPLFPAFGSHVLAARGDAIDILYLDRESEDRFVLKLA
jgi:hypothetical protein